MKSLSLLLLLPSCSLAAPEQKFLREPPDQVTMAMMIADAADDDDDDGDDDDDDDADDDDDDIKMITIDLRRRPLVSM